jgi:hypothetical protein
MSNALAMPWQVFVHIPPLGCAMGAIVTYPFGPMLIVFRMLFLGTLVVIIREAWLIIHDNHR